MGFTPDKLLTAIAQLPDAPRYWVAYSGGLDSHVLLHALARRRPRGALHAVHVDHGLHPESARWSAHCERTCAALGVPCRVTRVDAAPAPGQSPEAAARTARYTALQSVLAPGDCLLTAHHQDDQAETVLLQLLRGAGPRGLAGMPALACFGAGWLARPLLGFERAELREYALQHGLRWIEDSSNVDPRFDRNYLRHEILPRLLARWPGASRALARAARHNAEAAALLRALARIDLGPLRGRAPDTLSASALHALDPARRRNALRAWIEERGAPAPSSAQLEQALSGVLGCVPDAVPRLHWPGAELRRYRDEVYVLPVPAPHDPGVSLDWDMHEPLFLPAALGTLTAVPVLGAGLKAALCRRGPITVRFRRGGERCRPARRGHDHALKKLFQEQGVPPWQRDRIPLIYLGDGLAAVAGLWVCEPFQADPGEDGLQVQWRLPEDRGLRTED
ncbi:MAG: tRNA lysidine(34) synthetase TilS [Gammaproteobacteria bacterium]|nr:tRNA lysidine(34) synthetase TilS [Gammaproteobacteria bacterium]